MSFELGVSLHHFQVNLPKKNFGGSGLLQKGDPPSWHFWLNAARPIFFFGKGGMRAALLTDGVNELEISSAMLLGADGVFLAGTADTEIQIPKVRTSQHFSQHYSEIRKLGARGEIQKWVLQDGSHFGGSSHLVL